MKFTVNRERLAATLGKVMGAVEKRSTMPILTNVLMSVYLRGAVGFLATDLEVWAAAECETAPSPDGGRVCVQAEKLKGALASIDADEITVVRQGDEIKLTGGLFEFTLPLLPPDEFPEMTDDAAFYAEIPAGLLPRLIKAVDHAASRDLQKFNLCGVHIEGDMRADRLQAVATDGHRLSLASVAFENVGEVGKPLTLPSKCCNLVNGLFGPLEFKRAGAGVDFSSGSSQVVSRLIEADFPAYRRVIPTSLPSHLVARREALIGAVEAAVVMAEGEGRSVLLTWSAGEMLQVSALGPVGSCVAEVPCQSESEMGLTFRVNSRYLLQALQALDGDEVFLKWGSGHEPMVLMPVDLGHFDERLEVVMAMRL